MKNKSRLLISSVLVFGMLMVGCSSENNTLPENSQTNSGIEATSPKMSEDAAKAMQLEKSIDGIISITLKDLEGELVDRTFDEGEVAAIKQAFNDSFIMDTAYIEMITGYTMTIALENGSEVFITSYGQEGYIVARIGDGPSYHLGCELIGKILLSQE